MKIAICPTVYVTNAEHMKYACEALDSFVEAQRGEHYIYIDLFVNSCKPEFLGELEGKYAQSVTINPYNCLAASWNQAIFSSLARGCDYCIIPNLDVIVSRDAVINLVKFANKNSDAVMWSGYCNNHPHADKPDSDYVVAPFGMNNYDTYAFFMVNERLFERVGMFDQHYRPAYGEDVDMEYRIHLAKQKHMVCRSAEFYHHESITLKYMDDENMKQSIKRQDTPAIQWFNKKWGGNPRHQVFKHPFNSPKFNYKYIGRP